MKNGQAILILLALGLASLSGVRGWDVMLLLSLAGMLAYVFRICLRHVEKSEGE